MNRTIFCSFILIFSYFTLSSSCKPQLLDSTETFVSKTPGNFIEEWEQIRQLEQKGLAKDILVKLNAMLEQSEEDSNYVQIFKILAYQSKYILQSSEDAVPQIFSKYESKLRSSRFPIKQIFHSGLAEMYLWYYQQNRWRYAERTNAVDSQEENLLTWDLQKILEKIEQHYDSSLLPAKQLQSVDLNYAAEILIDEKSPYGKYGKELRPSLYDFLAHRALEFYKSGEAEALAPKKSVEITEDAFLQPKEFLKSYGNVEKGKLSNQAEALHIYQKLLHFHQSASHPNAFVHLQLDYFKFLRGNSHLINKDSLYLSALNSLLKGNKKATAAAEIYYEIAEFHLQHSTEMESKDKKKAEMQEAYKNAKKAVKDYANSFGAQKCKVLIFNLEQKELHFESMNAYPSMQWGLIGLSHKNIRNAYVSIVRSPFSAYQLHDLQTEKKIALLKKQQLVFSDTIDLLKEDDFLSHKSEYAIPPLKRGRYVIIVSNYAGLKEENALLSFQEIWISDISCLFRSQDGKIEVRALNRQSGRALRNLKVETLEQIYQPSSRTYTFKSKESTFTDHEGFAFFDAEKTTGNLTLLLTDGKDSLLTADNFRIYRSSREPEATRKRVYFFLDRSIYRPGQIVYFKTILTEEALHKTKAAANEKLAVKLYDANGREINSVDLKTNDYGSVEGFFTLPSTALTGNFRIGTDYGSHFFAVEEYKRPSFQVNFDTLNSEYSFNAPIPISGKVVTYTGDAVEEAEIQYTVVRKVFFPFPYYRRSFFPQMKEEVVERGTATTDSKGRFHFTYTAKGTEEKLGRLNYYYEITVDATSLSGETRSEKFMVQLGKESFLLSTDLPDKILSDSLGAVRIYAKNFAGNEIEKNIHVTVREAQASARILLPKMMGGFDYPIMDSLSYVEKFPYFPYGDEDIGKKGNVVLDLNISSAEQFQLNKLEPGTYILEAAGGDEKNPVSMKTTFTVFSKSASKPPALQSLYVLPLHKSAEVGKKATWLIGSSFQGLEVFYELEVAGAITEKGSLMLSEEQKTLSFPVKEEYRGGFALHFSAVRENRPLLVTSFIEVPFSNKKLDLQLSTFRKEVKPGSEEEWTVKIKNPDGSNAKAELLVSMHDASLDQFRPHAWNFNPYRSNYPRLSWNVSNSFSILHSEDFKKNSKEYFEYPQLNFPRLNWFGFHLGHSYRYANLELAGAISTSSKRKEEMAQMDAEDQTSSSKEQKNTSSDLKAIPLRKNFKETAFFYPQLSSNDSGEYHFSFTMPDALTEWKFSAFAHTTDLKYGNYVSSIISKKNLMLFPNMPRFFREGDTLTLSSFINNRLAERVNGEVRMQFFDPINEKQLHIIDGEDELQKFSIEKHGSTLASWKVIVPKNTNVIKYRIVAQAGQYSDGEEKTIPVLSRKILVTETMPFTVKGKHTEHLQFENFKKSKGKDVEDVEYSFEFTLNPMWTAVQALPSLIAGENENSEKIFARYFANALSSHILKTHPQIREKVEIWKKYEPDAFISNLEKNEELKAIVIEETPWLMAARDETQRRKRLAMLLDENRIQMELTASLSDLKQNQLSNGGWPWFSGGADDRYISQYIVAGFGHLRKLTKEEANPGKMLEAAVHYLDERMYEDYEKRAVGDSVNGLNALSIHYLYARSFFPDISMKKEHVEAMDFYRSLVQEKWLDQPLYMKGLIALILQRDGKTTEAKDILESLRQTAIKSEDKGMYWKNNTVGLYWYKSPIETQALLIEAFDEILDAGSAQKKEELEEMKIWLLRNKQTNNWGNSKATALACFSLLSTKEALMKTAGDVEIEVGGKEVDLVRDSQESSTGYIKKSWRGNEIDKNLANVKIENNTPGIAWGSLYWQYFSDIDEIKQSGKILDLKKELFAVEIKNNQEILVPTSGKIKVGEQVRVRIVLKVDRDMQYVHMKDLRASGLEPTEVLSGFRMQDGLSYYQSIKDASTDFFFTDLSKGIYVFEYTLRASIAGQFSNGISSIQCMYAPEFSSHSVSGKLEISPKK